MLLLQKERQIECSIKPNIVVKYNTSVNVPSYINPARVLHFTLIDTEVLCSREKGFNL